MYYMLPRISKDQNGKKEPYKKHNSPTLSDHQSINIFQNEVNSMNE